MKINKYDNSRKLMERAIKVIPGGVYGHLGPAEGCMIPVEAFPNFASRAEGAYFWDVDGNKYIDYMCAYGPNILGYNDPDVDAAARAQLEKMNCVTLPGEAMVDFAELLTGLTKKDWAFFCKNGGDVTLFSSMIARFYTGKKKMIFVNGYYHGVAPWSQKPDNPGTLYDDCKNSLYVDFNDLEGLKKIIAENKDDIAGLISTPYLHGNFQDNITPAEGYWPAVRKLCTENGIILIIDDIRCGFRLDLSGSDHFYGFEADLICFCKALANGYNVSALCGKEFLRGAANSIMYTGSYWMSAEPFAAGIACIKKLIANDACAHFKKIGTMLCEGLVKMAKEKGVNLHASGEPALFYLTLKDDNSEYLHQEWIAECVKRGLWLTNHHNHFINLAMNEDTVKETIAIAAEAMDAMIANNPQVYAKKKK